MRIPVKIFVQDPYIAEKYKKTEKFGIEPIKLDWEPSWGEVVALPPLFQVHPPIFVFLYPLFFPPN